MIGSKYKITNGAQKAMGKVKQHQYKTRILSKHESLSPPTNTDRTIASSIKNHHMVILDAGKTIVA